MELLRRNSVYDFAATIPRCPSDRLLPAPLLVRVATESPACQYEWDRGRFGSARVCLRVPPKTRINVMPRFGIGADTPRLMHDAQIESRPYLANQNRRGSIHI